MNKFECAFPIPLIFPLHFPSSTLFLLHSPKIAKMVQYKLYYFDTPGLAEPIRMLFHFAGQPFEDIRINKEKDWPKEKSKFFYQQVPLLEFDGKQLAQSSTIIKYLAKKFELAGKDEWEEAKASEIADLQKDLGFEIRPYVRVKFGFVKEGNLEQLRKDHFLPSIDKYLPLYEKLLAQSGSGFMLPSGISYVDIVIAYFLGILKDVEKEVISKYPTIVEYVDRVYGQPTLKEYLSKRKAYGEMNG